MNDAIVSTKSLVKMLSSGHKKQNQQINVPWLPVPNRIFSMWSKLDTLPIFTVRYIAPTDEKIYDISMLGYDTRDTIQEHKFVQLVIRNSISGSVFLSPGPGMINFAGRIVQLKNNFEWMAPDNIYCPGKGQMNWSVHSSMNKAIRARDFQLIQNADRKLMEILKRDTVPVSFEGSNVQALRIIYKSKVPRIFWGKGSKVLHV